jgi:predicted homoserine dehydrogenase-like protein
VVVEVTGNIPFGAEVTLEAIRHHKHVVSMNAELDGTIGPLLKVLADREGVIFTNSDGDQPGVILNLYRFVKGIGLRPVLCGNNKGLQDPYRNPTTQQEFATNGGRNPIWWLLCRRTKISYERRFLPTQRMRVARRNVGFELPPAREWKI